MGSHLPRVGGKGMGLEIEGVLLYASLVGERLNGGIRPRVQVLVCFRIMSASDHHCCSESVGCCNSSPSFVGGDPWSLLEFRGSD